MMNKLVWIDAGHGGKDNGESSKKLKEKDKALEISLGNKKLLESLRECTSAATPLSVLHILALAAIFRGAKASIRAPFLLI